MGVEVVVVRDHVSRGQPEPEPEPGIVGSERMRWGLCTRHARERFYKTRDQLQNAGGWSNKVLERHPAVAAAAWACKNHRKLKNFQVQL